MQVNFNLVSPSRKVSSIRVVVTHRSKVYRASIGISCRTADWSTKKQRALNVQVNEEVRRIRNRLEQHLSESMSPDEIRHVMEWAITKLEQIPAKGSELSFWDIFDEFSSAPNIKDATRITREVARRRLSKILPEDVSWDDIDLEWMEDLAGRMKDEGMGTNTVKMRMDIVRGVMRRADRKGLLVHRNVLDFKMQLRMPDTVYLTDDELELLWNVRLKEKWSIIRDLFLLECYTAARVSDCFSMSLANIEGDRLKYVQKKTGQPIVLPVKPRVRTLLQRLEGKTSTVHYYDYSIYIRKICKQAGINRQVVVTKEVDGVLRSVRVPKYELVTSHTGRRTACTTLYKSGVPMKVCMYLSGHKSERCFMQYIRLTMEEGADLLSQCSFFQ